MSSNYDVAYKNYFEAKHQTLRDVERRAGMSLGARLAEEAMTIDHLQGNIVNSYMPAPDMIELRTECPRCGRSHNRRIMISQETVLPQVERYMCRCDAAIQIDMAKGIKNALRKGFERQEYKEETPSQEDSADDYYDF